MLKTTTYLVEQVHSVVYSPSGSTPNRNMTMYARNLKVYKGADNPIVIEIKNNESEFAHFLFIPVTIIPAKLSNSVQ